MSQPSWIGQTLNGRYVIEALLGQGGMSAVYRANDPNLKRTVAIKLIHSHLSGDKQFIERFEEEAAAIASLRHHNIVQVYDFNSDADVHYMVLEYLRGETLFDRMQNLSSQGKKLPIEDAIQYTLNICAALTYAHQRGIIHRDIKPANIMLNEEGQAILMDFGIVKIVGGSSHTATGAVLGTARYISPEVIRSEPADQRSDIYSLGITLYEMFSGATPFQADSTLTLMMMHLNDPVPDPRSLRADLSPALVNILLKALQKDRNKRYQTAAEMAAALKNALKEMQPSSQSAPEPTNSSAHFSEPARGYTPSSEPRTSAKSSPWLWVLGLGAAALVFVVTLAAIGIFLLSRQAASPAPKTAATSLPAATAAGAEQPANNPILIEPTATLPVYYVRILNISRRGGQYEVQYETIGFTEHLPWTHIHFFFDTVSPEQAGKPGNGPWIVYDGPRPYNKFNINQTPAGASKMCALVANANHSVIQGSGNCLDLPQN